MSLTDFLDYLITHDETRELGADLAHAYLAHAPAAPVVAEADEAA